MRKAKIVCTIGPASDGVGVLEQLIQSGMNAARLNFSHGTHASHGQAIKVIREAADRQGVAVAIIQDLQGPRIRVGEIDGTLELRAGQRVRLRTMTLRSGGQIGARNVLPADSAQDIPVTYQALTRDIRP
ncbi:MAG TPA: pyruvate kinase, partial [Nitrospira sp.]|nr:pyruvate kinase [Nitrospira sp.]